jgi:uncharacterized protein YeeX (DUF496 family)
VTSNYLDLNKKHIRQSVIYRLRLLGYQIDDGISIRRIQEIVMMVQRDNGLMMDGYIGVRTMHLLGYSAKEIKKMLKISSSRSSYYPQWLLYF